MHEPVVEKREISLRKFAIQVREISNGEFLEFVRASGHKPAQAQNFLAHWPGGNPSIEILDKAVVYVSLADARAYAAWKGWRLPTDAEWQVAVEQHPELRKDSKVWNWTDSEYDDGRTRFVILKGGCSYEAKGSEWYADGGLRPPEFAAKFIEIWEALDRCETIGFRCAVDLE